VRSTFFHLAYYPYIGPIVCELRGTMNEARIAKVRRVAWMLCLARRKEVVTFDSYILSERAGESSSLGGSSFCAGIGRIVPRPSEKEEDVHEMLR
jgi:hypothetical protein